MPAAEICILAGGLSARMGCDKARLRLHGKTLLRRVRDAAEETGWPVRVIRRDAVARCGPLGGVYTALRTARADSVLFLACDMPFITAEILQKILQFHLHKRDAVFARHGAGKVGFPFILRRDHLNKVEKQLAERRFSIQALAALCSAKVFTPRSARGVFFNVNTPEDWARARKMPV